MSDKLVIDIETKNTFADVGGQRFLTDLDVSLTGVYSYNRDEYSSFKDDEMEKATYQGLQSKAWNLFL